MSVPCVKRLSKAAALWSWRGNEDHSLVHHTLRWGWGNCRLGSFKNYFMFFFQFENYSI